MRQSEFDKISAALDRAEFALRELRKKEVQLHRKRYLAKSMEEIEALNLEAGDLLLALRKINDAVHAGNPAPHLRLVPDTEHEAFMDKRQPPPRRRLLKSGKILLGRDPIPCTVRNLSETGACLQVQTTVGFPPSSTSSREVIRLKHARRSGVTIPRSGSSSSNGNSARESPTMAA
jgi:hypothetical protein